jgi:tetratricopeptide (TPR) repeat protein
MPQANSDDPSRRWERVQALFEQALESDDPEPLLAAEPDRDLADQVRRLLANHYSADEESFLAEPSALIRHLTEEDPPVFEAGDVLAERFAIERLLGRGGMGEVYLAHDRLLGEPVALKTIRASLAGDQTVCRRFLDEVRSARSVTHRNVCRIFDLFEDGGAPFYSMEYVGGATLQDWLRGDPPADSRRRVALELAEGLEAAHRRRILHCDFKPGNILVAGDGPHTRPAITDFGLARALSGADGPNVYSLEAGTLAYMAPELVAGGAATFATDIYAYGRVLSELMPGSRLAQACTARKPEDRPVSLEPVIRSLRGVATRRLLLMAAAAAPFAGLAAWLATSRPRLPLLSRQRLAFNAFRPKGEGSAQLVRDLLLTALRQSLLVTIVPDEHVRSALRALSFAPELPADRVQLLAAAARDGIGLVVEGNAVQAGSGLSFLLQVYRAGESQPALQIAEKASDRKAIVGMAERLALQVRREFGEPVSQAGYTPIDRITSPNAAAVEYYFRGQRLYENAEAEAAINWFDEAIAADPNFALAHLALGIALAARYQTVDCLPPHERAFSLRSRVSERERLWIEGRYFNIVSDYVASLAPCRRLVALYPDEDVFQRNVAFAYAATGRAMDGLSYSRRALELEPSSVNNASELIVNQAEAGLCDEALALHRQLRSQGQTSTLLDWGAGLALMVQGRTREAETAFQNMGNDARRERWARLLRCGPQILDGRFDEAAGDLRADLAWDVAMKEQSHMLTRRVWLGHLEALMDQPAAAREQARELAAMPLSPIAIEELREAALIAVSIGERDVASLVLGRLRELEARWPSTHSHGVRLHVEGLVIGGDSGGDLFNQAVGLWPDPPALFARGRWLTSQGRHSAALADFEGMERLSGRVMKRHFPGLRMLGWWERAKCLNSLSRFGEALRLYEQLGKYWLTGAREFGILTAIREEKEQAQRLHKGEK